MEVHGGPKIRNRMDEMMGTSIRSKQSFDTDGVI